MGDHAPSDEDPVDTPPATTKEMPRLEGSGAVTVPFFTWRVRSHIDAMGAHQGSEGPVSEAAVQDLYRILGKINETICSDVSGIGELYSKAYRCTKENCLKRHPDLTRDKPTSGTETEIPSPSTPAAADGKRNEKSKEPLNEDDAQPQAQSQPEETGKGKGKVPLNEGHDGPQNGSTSVRMLHPVEVLGKQLFEVSQTIMSEFLPKDEHSLYHVVCERFWGTVDEILRVRATTTLTFSPSPPPSKY
jgi:hypothetical protein